MSQYSFKKYIKQNQKKYLIELKNKREKQIKMVDLTYSELSIQEYLLAGIIQTNL